MANSCGILAAVFSDKFTVISFFSEKGTKNHPRQVGFGGLCGGEDTPIIHARLLCLCQGNGPIEITISHTCLILHTPNVLV